MNRRAIVVTEPDLQRLQTLLQAQSRTTMRDKEHLRDLEEELGRANVVDARKLPEGVVTMHAQVCVQDVQTGESRTYTLVFPHDADVASGRLSVLAPLGTALLGYREGDEIEWEMPGGVRQLRIREVRQPSPSADDPGAAPELPVMARG